MSSIHDPVYDEFIKILFNRGLIYNNISIMNYYNTTTPMILVNVSNKATVLFLEISDFKCPSILLRINKKGEACQFKYSQAWTRPNKDWIPRYEPLTLKLNG